MPFEDGTPFFLCEFAEEAEAICPRGLLRRVLAKAAEMGFSVLSALEYEFFLFDETPDSVREKGYRNLKPMTPGFFGYSVLRSSVHAEFYRELLDTCRAMDMALEGLHTETGPGRARGGDRASTRRSRAADKAALFKTFTKVLAQRRGLDGDLHGEVVARLAGPERPHPPVAQGRGRQAGLPRRQGRARHERRRCASSSAASRR